MQGLKNADILMPQTFYNEIWSSYVSDLYGFGGSDKVWRAKLPEILQKCPGSILHNCAGADKKSGNCCALLQPATGIVIVLFH